MSAKFSRDIMKFGENVVRRHAAESLQRTTHIEPFARECGSAPTSDTTMRGFASTSLRRVTKLMPMVPYVYFDSASSRIPDRYRLLRSHDDARAWSVDSVAHSLDAMYYDVLNVAGSRLRADSMMRITIVGFRTAPPRRKRGEPKRIAIERATAVRDYLRDVWHVRDVQMTLRASGSNLPSVYHALTRRVEIHLSHNPPIDRRNRMPRDSSIMARVDAEAWAFRRPVDVVDSTALACERIIAVIPYEPDRGERFGVLHYLMMEHFADAIGCAIGTITIFGRSVAPAENGRDVRFAEFRANEVPWILRHYLRDTTMPMRVVALGSRWPEYDPSLPEGWLMNGNILLVADVRKREECE